MNTVSMFNVLRHTLLEENSVSGGLEEDVTCCKVSPGLDICQQKQGDEKHPGASQARDQAALRECGDGDR